MSFDAKFAVFWSTLSQHIELSDELQTNFRQALVAAGFDTPLPPQTSPATPVAPKAKKQITGYNLFMREKSAELKASGTDNSNRMKQVGVHWKALSQADKDNYKLRAKAMIPTPVPTPAPAPSASQVAGATAPKVPKTMTGYQLYVRETMPSVVADASIGVKERMAKVGERWKAEAESTKLDFSNRAATMLTGTPPA